MATSAASSLARSAEWLVKDVAIVSVPLEPKPLGANVASPNRSSKRPHHTVVSRSIVRVRALEPWDVAAVVVGVVDAATARPGAGPVATADVPAPHPTNAMADATTTATRITTSVAQKTPVRHAFAAIWSVRAPVHWLRCWCGHC